MKKNLFLAAMLAALAFGATTMTSCSEEVGEPPPGSKGKITIETACPGHMEWFMLAGNGNATIDWGDGSAIDKVRLRALPSHPSTILDKLGKGWDFPHIYAGSDIKTITVTGDVTGIVLGATYEATALDVSDMPGLKLLYCEYENLRSLDLGNNPGLEMLYCSYNRLLSLDLERNAELAYLYCSYNNLRSLDLSNNTALKGVHCRYNRLESLDVGRNADLKYLYCSDNRLRSLDLSQCNALKGLGCWSNLLSLLTLGSHPDLGGLDYSDNRLEQAALVEIFEKLPMRTTGDYAEVHCDGNPGYTKLADDHIEIAEGKNWEIAKR